MHKKLITSAALLLAVSPALPSVLTSTLVSADTDSSTIRTNVSPREIMGRFSGEIHEGMGISSIGIGAFEYIVPPFLMLDVIDGGPESLSWSASVYNVTTGELVNDWQEFKHGGNDIIFNLDKTKVHVGDQLKVNVHANSGKGNITFIAGI